MKWERQEKKCRKWAVKPDIYHEPVLSLLPIRVRNIEPDDIHRTNYNNYATSPPVITHAYGRWKQLDSYKLARPLPSSKHPRGSQRKLGLRLPPSGEGGVSVVMSHFIVVVQSQHELGSLANLSVWARRTSDRQSAAAALVVGRRQEFLVFGRGLEGTPRPPSRSVILKQGLKDGVGKIGGMMIVFFGEMGAGGAGRGRGIDKAAPVGIQREGGVEGFGAFVAFVHVLHVHGIGDFHVGIVVHAEVLKRPSRRIMMAHVNEDGDQGEDKDEHDGNGHGQTQLRGRPLGRATCAGMGSFGTGCWCLAMVSGKTGRANATPLPGTGTSVEAVFLTPQRLLT